MKARLLDQARELSIDERVQLAEAIWGSIDEQHVPPLTDAQKAELDRRLVDHENNPDDVLPWDEVKAFAIARIGR